MSNMDLTTFTEVDSASDLTVTSSKITFDTLRNDAIASVSTFLPKFDFRFEFEVKIDAVSGTNGDAALAGMSNVFGPNAGISDMAAATDGIIFTAFANSGNLQFKLIDFSNMNVDSYTAGGTSTPILYCVFERVGTTATVRIYDDSGRTNRLDTLSITCENEEKEYFYGLIAADASGNPSDSLTGYVQNIFIEELDLTQFVEIDSDGDITVTRSNVHFSSVRNDARSYVFHNFGFDYFTDFSMDFEVEINSVNGNFGVVLLAGISNTVGTRTDMYDANDGIVFGAMANVGNLTFFLADYSTDNQDNYYHGGTTSPIYFCTLERLGSITTVKIYSDSHRSTLVDTLSIASDTDPKQHLYAFSSADWSVDGGDQIDGFTRNFNISHNFASQANIVSHIQNSYIVGPNYFDLTTFTEVDSDSDITVTQPNAAFDTMRGDATSYLYKDMGASYFTDFAMDFEFKIDAIAGNTGYLSILAVSNTIGTLTDRNTANDSIEFNVYANAGNLRFEIWDRSSEVSDSYIYGGSSSGELHCHFQRVGTLALVRIYSDYKHTILLDEISITCEANPKRYLYALSSEGSGGSADTMTGYVQYFERDNSFHCAPVIDFSVISTANLEIDFSDTFSDIVSSITSSGNAERSFASQADIVSGVSNIAINRFFGIASQADIAFNINDLGFAIERHFNSQADIVSNISDPVISFGNEFLTQPIINSVITSDVHAEKQFSCQADIVSGITNPVIDQGGMFHFNAGIATNIRSNAFALNKFYVLNDVITSVISDPVIRANRNFVSQADIVFDTVSSGDGNRIFAVSAGIVSDISSNVEKTNTITSQADIGIVIASDIRQPYLFSVQADIGIGIASDARAERILATQADIGTGIVSGITNERQFSVAPAIVSNINDVQEQVKKQFASQVDISFAVWSFFANPIIQARREFASQANMGIGISTAMNQRMEFLSQMVPDGGIVSVISSAAKVRRNFEVHRGYPTTHISWNAVSSMGSGIILTSAPAITFSAVSDAAREIQFGSLPELSFDFSVNIFNERRFSTQADIVFDISDLFHIYVIRNLGSTVNIIVDVECLNILNMGIDELFPIKFKSLTPKQTATLIGV